MVKKKLQQPLTKLVGCGKPLFAVRWAYGKVRQEYMVHPAAKKITQTVCGSYIRGQALPGTQWKDRQFTKAAKYLCEQCIVKNGVRW